MALTQTRYNTCAYQHDVTQSVGVLGWVMDSNRNENCNKCRIEFGVVGGTNVGHPRGDIVDVESDLKGITRLHTKCPTLQYLNPCPKGDMNTCQPKQILIRSTPNTRGRVVSTEQQQLPACQMFRYKSIPLPPPMTPVKCNYY